MSDDFGTLGVRRGAGAREFEILRKHYRDHRAALSRMAGEAPTEQLASEYTRLVAEIDAALVKLDELEGRSAVPPPMPSRNTAPLKEHGDPLRQEVGAGTRPLVTPSTPDYGATVTPAGSGRTIAILGVGVVVIALIGWLVWRASRDRRTAEARSTPPVVTETEPASAAPTAVAAAPRTIAPATALSVAPATSDYGTIRKGTRAVRQFEVTNSSGSAIQYQVARSQCRCLYYEYKGKLAPKQHETLTVTIDGAKAKAGALQETVAISSKSDPNLASSFEVTAMIK